MSERSLESEAELDVDTAVDESAGSAAETPEAGAGTRLRSRARSLFSTRGFGVGLVLSLGGAALAGSLVPLGFAGEPLGVFAGAFLYGLGTETRRYLELALAGALAGAGSALLGNVALSVLGVGLPLVAAGAVAGLAAGVTGHYFGRDLRDGLTREVR